MKAVKCEVYSRVVGYMRPVSQWNDGKKEEFSQRKTYKFGDVSEYSVPMKERNVPSFVSNNPMEACEVY